jgi:transposase InsO family protein
MEERWELVCAWRARVFSMSELCAHFGVSRKTGYKWVERYEEGGVAGLSDRCRAPYSCPHRTSDEVAEAIVGVRRQHPRWGPKKILDVLARSRGELQLPAVSTAGAVLQRAGLVQGRRRRSRWAHPGRSAVTATRPNEVWTVDFKGQFRLGDRSMCYPLTVQDQFSRYLVACRGLSSTHTSGVRSTLRRVFRECGMPEAIRTDNGSPFASPGLYGLTRLNVWWLRLGIRHDRIQKGHPEQNGSHERMHRDLKAEATRPPSSCLSSQQRRFDRFGREYNAERPHEGIGQRRPAELWTPPTRCYPSSLREPEYPGHLEVRRVRTHGEIKFHGRRVFLSESLAGELVGLEPVDEGLWSVIFNTTLLARYNERNHRIYG